MVKTSIILVFFSKTFASLHPGVQSWLKGGNIGWLEQRRNATKCTVHLTRIKMIIVICNYHGRLPKSGPPSTLPRDFEKGIFVWIYIFIIDQYLWPEPAGVIGTITHTFWINVYNERSVAALSIREGILSYCSFNQDKSEIIATVLIPNCENHSK